MIRFLGANLDTMMTQQHHDNLLENSNISLTAQEDFHSTMMTLMTTPFHVYFWLKKGEYHDDPATPR